MRTLPCANIALTASAALMLLTALPRDPPSATLDETLASASAELPPASGPTVLLAFHSRCGACRVAAPHWREWTALAEARVLAISPEPLAVARAYGEAHRWNVPVLSVPDRPDRWITPWAYVYDAAGTLVWDGTGHDLNPILELLEELS